MKMEIRPLADDDMDRFVEIWDNHAAYLTSSGIEPYKEGLKNWQDYGKEIGLKFYAIDKDDEMIGFMISKNTDEGIYIDQLAISEGLLRKGIGTRLLHQIEEDTSGSITTQVLFNNLIGINFLISRGFRIIGFNQRKDGYKLEKEV